MAAFFKRIQPNDVTQIPEPGIARFLFADTRMAVVWLVVRVYLGYQWISAGYEKMTGNYLFGGATSGGSWISGAHVGAAITGFAKGALAKSSGSNPAVQGWYADFLKNIVIPHASVFAYLITFGELLVGIGLIVGALTGVAAFFGLIMNFNYLLAGTVSTNPILGFIAIFLVLAWRVAGYWGLDRYLLPALGTPWTGSLLHRNKTAAPVTPTPKAA